MAKRSRQTLKKFFSSVGTNPRSLTAEKFYDLIDTLSESESLRDHVSNRNRDEKHLTNKQLSMLIKLLEWLKVDEDGTVHTEGDFYSAGSVSAFGKTEEGGDSGGGHDMLLNWLDYDDSRKDWVVSAELLVSLRNALENKANESDLEGLSNDVSSIESRVSELEEGGSDKYYVHEQSTLDGKMWHVYHNLKKYPSVTVFDSAGTEVIGDVTHVSENYLTIEFSAEFSGKAICN